MPKPIPPPRLLKIFCPQLLAAYLSIAEYARWNLTAQNGMLSAMYRHNIHFYVVGTTIRYRREIRPLFRKFQVDTTVCGIQGRTMYMSHKFRLPAKGDHPESRVMAQMIVQGVAVQGGGGGKNVVVDFADFLKNKAGFDADVIDRVMLPAATTARDNDDGNSIGSSGDLPEIIQRYLALEDAMKNDAAEDDRKLEGN
jgi:acyl-CoA thioesterase FadM